MQITVDLFNDPVSSLIMARDLIVEQINERPSTSATPPALPVADNPATGLDTKELFAAPVPPLAPSGVAANQQMTALAAQMATIPALPPAVSSPVPPLAPATVAPTAATPAPASGERDAEGMPWDERIHSSTKAKTEKGLWRIKRGINDPQLIARVKAELLAVQPSATPQPTIPAPVFQAPQPAPVLAPQQSFQPAPVMPQPTQQQAASPTDFNSLMTLVGPMIAQQKIAPDALNAAVMSFGLANLAALAQNPAYVPMVWAKLTQG